MTKEGEHTMDKRLSDILSGREGNHLLPFLWMRAGHTAELEGLVDTIWRSGERAFCVESRPHEGFCGPDWWKDMDIVVKAARDRGMKVWILDDKHFPTGYAAGLIPKKYPHLRKWQLLEEHVDVAGPAPHRALLITQPGEDEVLIGAYAYPRTENTEALDGTFVDLTDRVKGRYIYWDVPEGVWRVVALFKSRRGTQQKDYIHLIDPESVHVLIEAVYEPHYAHYRDDFGTTIAGFFSDEPSLGNDVLWGDAPISMYEYRVGHPGLALPWTDELLSRLNEAMGRDVRGLLMGLWYDMGEITPRLRVAYMDVLTALWREHFSYQLGNWCRDHGVEYIGHIIEDKNAHARTGCSGGHYFRSLDGQDMAGIDVVLHQIMPGLAHYQYSMICATRTSDPEFFHYVLGRLAASLSHVNPRMKGRAMCEIFGAYGWAEGVPMMRQLMDHMLVRGVNYFVPHAFSPDYPDPDCPPHFNGGGCNPGFSGFSKLMRYTNKVTHLLEGGTEIVSAAILYHAEAEWSGRDYMLSQKPAKALYDRQLNYDIVPIDTVMNDMTVDPDGALRVGDMRYPALIVPYASYLPAPFIERAASLAAQGARVAYVDALPEGCETGTVVPLAGVADYAAAVASADLRPEKPFPLLRHLHVKRDGVDVWMVVNESGQEDFDGALILPVEGDGACLDLLGPNSHRVTAKAGRVSLSLRRGESALLVFGGGAESACGEALALGRTQTLKGPWTLSMTAAHGRPCDGGERVIDELYDVTGPAGDDGFSGWMRYLATFEAEKGAAWLDLGSVGECARVRLNGVDLGERIGEPYAYDITGAAKEGENTLEVEVTNSLVHQQPDGLSTFVPIGPSGLLGPVTIRYTR